MRRVSEVLYLRCALGAILLGGLTACAAPFQEPTSSPSIGLEPTVVPRLLPPEYVIPYDDRPLAWRQQDLLLDAFETESRALALETEMAKASPDGGKNRLDRIPGDRTILNAQLTAAKAWTKDEPPPPNTLKPIDRLLIEFARERLVTDGYSLKQLDDWWRNNRKFLNTRDLADRDAALAARKPALLSMAKATPLRQLMMDARHGELTDATRAEWLGSLKLVYPDSQLPVAAVDSVIPAKAGSSTGEKGPQDTGLPKLDGASHPVRAIENLGALIPSTKSTKPS